jgi:uncharacterized membrane protein
VWDGRGVFDWTDIFLLLLPERVFFGCLAVLIVLIAMLAGTYWLWSLFR